MVDRMKYFVSFLDDISHFRMRMVFLMKYKSDVFKYFKEYEMIATSKFGCCILSFRSDLGKKYFFNEQLKYYKDKEILSELNVAYTPQRCN